MVNELSLSAIESQPENGLWYLRGSHGRAVAALSQGLRDREILLLLTGPAGTGKSTVLSAVLSEISKEFVRIIRLGNPGVSVWNQTDLAAQFLGRLMNGFTADRTTVGAIEKLTEAAPPEEQVVIAVDDAETLTDDAMELLLRVASPLGRAGLPPQLIMAGRGEFWERQWRSELQLIARLADRLILEPLSGPDAQDYIRFRLNRPGGTIDDMVTSKALTLISLDSCGLPGRIDRVLTASNSIRACRGSHVLTADIVMAAIDSLAPAPAVSRAAMMSPIPPSTTDGQASVSPPRVEPLGHGITLAPPPDLGAGASGLPEADRITSRAALGPAAALAHVGAAGSAPVWPAQSKERGDARAPGPDPVDAPRLDPEYAVPTTIFLPEIIPENPKPFFDPEPAENSDPFPSIWRIAPGWSRMGSLAGIASVALVFGGLALMFPEQRPSNLNGTDGPRSRGTMVSTEVPADQVLADRSANLPLDRGYSWILVPATGSAPGPIAPPIAPNPEPGIAIRDAASPASSESGSAAETSMRASASPTGSSEDQRTSISDMPMPEAPSAAVGDVALARAPSTNTASTAGDGTNPASPTSGSLAVVTPAAPPETSHASPELTAGTTAVAVAGVREATGAAIHPFEEPASPPASPGPDAASAIWTGAPRVADSASASNPASNITIERPNETKLPAVREGSTDPVRDQGIDPGRQRDQVEEARMETGPDSQQAVTQRNGDAVAREDVPRQAPANENQSLSRRATVNLPSDAAVVTSAATFVPVVHETSANATPETPLAADAPAPALEEPPQGAPPAPVQALPQGSSNGSMAVAPVTRVPATQPPRPDHSFMNGLIGHPPEAASRADPSQARPGNGTSPPRLSIDLAAAVLVTPKIPRSLPPPIAASASGAQARAAQASAPVTLQSRRAAALTIAPDPSEWTSAERKPPPNVTPGTPLVNDMPRSRVMLATDKITVAELRCRSIVLRAGLGEDLTNDDRVFLRGGCQEHR